MRTFCLLLFVAGSVLSAGCLGPRRFCGDAPGCGVGDCNHCDDCGTLPVPCTPWDHLRQHCGFLTCGAGCGDVYVDEWYSHPPDCHDPCDGCNQWVGGDGCKCLPLSRFDGIFAGLRGRRFRCDDTCGFFDCMAGFCDVCDSDPCSCGGGHVAEHGEYYDEYLGEYEGEVWSEGEGTEIFDSGTIDEPQPAPANRVQPVPQNNAQPGTTHVAPPSMRTGRGRSIRSTSQSARQPQPTIATPPISIRR